MRRRTPFPSAAGTIAVGAVMLMVVLGACGSSSSSSSPSSSGGKAAGSGTGKRPSASARDVYRKCLADNGVKVPSTPGQGGGGQGANGFGQGPSNLPADVDRATLDKAREACKDKLPSLPGVISPQDPAQRAALESYAACLTQNGYTAPDASHGPVVFNGGIDRSDPDFKAADEHCASVRPGAAPAATTTSRG